MVKIFVVGNAVRDTYLKLDPLMNRFEKDQNGVEWLDVAFDGRSMRFFKKTVIRSGMYATREVLENFGLEVSLHSGREEIERVVLSSDENVTVLVPSRDDKLPLTLPDEPADWIVVDASEYVDLAEAKKISEHIVQNPGVKLAVFVTKYMDKVVSETLLAHASLVATHSKDDFGATPTLCIEEDSLRYGDLRVPYAPPKFVTHMAADNRALATFLGAKLAGFGDADALKITKINTESDHLAATYTLEQLRDVLAQRHEEF